MDIQNDHHDRRLARIAEVIDKLSRQIDQPIHTLLSQIPSRIRSEMKRTIISFMGATASSFQRIYRAILEFFSLLPTRTWSGLIQAGRWLVMTIGKFFRWLWKTSRAEIALAAVKNFVLVVLRWTAIVCGAVGCLYLAIFLGQKFYLRHKDRRRRKEQARRDEQARRAIEQLERENVRRQQAEEAARKQQERDEARRREEEAARVERERIRRQNVADKERQKLSDAFEQWVNKVQCFKAVGKQALKSIPQPPAVICLDATCKARKENMGLDFCIHRIQKPMEAYYKVKGVRMDNVLRRQKFIWHPDKFVGYNEQVCADVEEIMKFLNGLGS